MSDRSSKHQLDNVEMIISGSEKNVGDFSVRRILPIAKRRQVGPWIFFDHMGPVEFPPGKSINVRPHPHINLATVTYLFEGEILHRDSLGSEQIIQPGDINLMVAGSGIVHSERGNPKFENQKKRLHGLQLWLALPSELEETEPAFYHYPSDSIPTTSINGVSIRVMMGTAYNLTSPVKCLSETLYVEARLKPGQKLTLPSSADRAIYVADGKIKIENSDYGSYEMIVLHPQSEVTIEATEPSFIAIIGGQPLGERHMYWNFASSSKERIEAAKEKWRSGNFPKVPGDEIEFIPLPE